MEIQRVKNSQDNPKEEKQGWSTYTARYQDLAKTFVISSGWYWCKDRQINGLIEIPEIDPYIYGCLMYDKDHIAME